MSLLVLQSATRYCTCMAKTPPFSIRLDEDLRERADKVADEENRSLGNLIETALRFYLDHKDKGRRK